MRRSRVKSRGSRARSPLPWSVLRRGKGKHWPTRKPGTAQWEPARSTRRGAGQSERARIVTLVFRTAATQVRQWPRPRTTQVEDPYSFVPRVAFDCGRISRRVVNERPSTEPFCLRFPSGDTRGRQEHTKTRRHACPDSRRWNSRPVNAKGSNKFLTRGSGQT